MDLFTHVILGYLLSYGLVGYAPQYLAAGALAGGLPDADAFFYPLSRRFPILRHHGITHSIFGVTVVALVGGLVVAPRILPGSPLVYFLVMEAGGLAHMLGDAFTHFSVAPLLPFSPKPLEIDADRAINFVTLVASVGSLVLLGSERFNVPFSVYTWTIYGMMAFYGGYLGLRLWLRARMEAIRRTVPGGFTHVAPTGNPLRWMLLYERREGGHLSTGYLTYRFGRGVVDGPHALDVPLSPEPGEGGPVRTREDALRRSYPLARTTSTVLDDTYHTACAVPLADGGWNVVWYSLEFSAFGRAAAVRVRVAPDGGLTAKSAWFPLSELRAPAPPPGT